VTVSYPILVEARGPVLYVTLNRPEVLNAQNQAMRVALVEAIDRLDDDDDLRVGVLTGSGGRAFSAGADLKEIRESDHEVGRTLVPVEDRPQWIHFRRVERARKPLIAAIDGYAVGGGLELALLCDIRMATEPSTFALPEPRSVGGVAEVAVHRLSRLIPLGEALRMHLTASPITAHRAYQVGLIQYLLPDRQSLFAAVEEVAGEMLQCASGALLLGKLVSRHAAQTSVADSERLLLELQRGSARRGA
jgi:enoyl-CoA hydratase/carnithine racemase